MTDDQSTAPITAASPIHNEAAMREEKPPRCTTPEELIAYIQSKVNGGHDYGTCVYAMALAAQAAFEYAAHKLRVTGFQASCADLTFLAKVRSIEGPFTLLLAKQALYPQYDLRREFETALTEWKPCLKEQAAKLLAETPEGQVAPSVREHWKMLAGS